LNSVVISAFRLIVAGLAGLSGCSAALACTPNPDPDLRPWGQRVTGSNPMFVGTVVEIRGAGGQVWTEPPTCETPGANAECEAYHWGLADVVFAVELPIIGDLKLGDAFVIEQGHGSDCRIEFRIGQRWLFAGNFNESPSMYLNEAREGLN
jgi:hypothetical protein